MILDFGTLPINSIAAGANLFVRPKVRFAYSMGNTEFVMRKVECRFSILIRFRASYSKFRLMADKWLPVNHPQSCEHAKAMA